MYIYRCIPTYICAQYTKKSMDHFLSISQVIYLSPTYIDEYIIWVK